MYKNIPLLIGVLVFVGCTKRNNSETTHASEKTEPSPWGAFKYSTVKGYVAKYPWTKEPLIVGHKIYDGVYDKKGVELTKEQQHELIEIMGKSGHDTSATDCFNPRHGFIFWDSVNNPVAHVSICFDCGRIAATPVLSETPGLTELNAFCKKIGLPVFDDFELYECYFDSLSKKHL